VASRPLRLAPLCLGPVVAGLVTFVAWAGVASAVGLPQRRGLAVALLASVVAVAFAFLAAAAGFVYLSVLVHSRTLLVVATAG